MALYRFILTPIDTIFFGREKSPFKEEYFQVSHLTPQQTAVLGFLRHEVLRRSGSLNENNSQWQSLIGSASFNGSEDQSFGLIQSIGPVGVYYNDLVLHPYRYFEKACLRSVKVKVDFGDQSDCWEGMDVFEKSSMDGRFNPKNKDHFKMIFTDFDSVIRDAEGKGCANSIFYRDIRAGITKSYTGTPNEEGYFKTSFLRMNRGYAYTFRAEIEEHELLSSHSWITHSIVRFGGDRSVYMLNVKMDEFRENEEKGRFFVLTSDSLIENSIYNYCSSAVTDTRHFRNIISRPLTAGDFRNERPGSQNNDKSKVMLAAGSILIARSDQSAEGISYGLKRQVAFRKIGYNHFKRFSSLPNITLS